MFLVSCTPILAILALTGLEDYLVSMMINGADKSNFVIIRIDLENNMTCWPDSESGTNDKKVGILQNYHVGKQHTRATPVEE